MKIYCTQNFGDCETCSLVNYNYDCHNKKIERGVMYADTINGKFDMTYADMLQQVRENPIFTNPGEVAFVGTDREEFTGTELLGILGLKNEAEDM